MYPAKEVLPDADLPDKPFSRQKGPKTLPEMGRPHLKMNKPHPEMDKPHPKIA